jgi:hypothetical protein
MVTIQIAMSQEEVNRLRLLAHKEMRTVNDQVRYLLRQGAREKQISAKPLPEDLADCPPIDLS